MQRHARFLQQLLQVAWDERNKQLYSTVILNIEGTEKPGRSGLCTGEEMLFFALGLFRASTSSEHGDLIGPAREILRAAAGRLDIHRKKFKGKEVSQLAWVVPRLAECLR